MSSFIHSHHEENHDKTCCKMVTLQLHSNLFSYMLSFLLLLWIKWRRSISVWFISATYYIYDKRVEKQGTEILDRRAEYPMKLCHLTRKPQSQLGIFSLVEMCHRRFSRVGLKCHRETGREEGVIVLLLVDIQTRPERDGKVKRKDP